MLLDLAEEELRCVGSTRLRAEGPDQSTTRCGAIQLSFQYSPASRKLSVGILRSYDLPSRDRGGANSVQVTLFLIALVGSLRHLPPSPGTGGCFGMCTGLSLTISVIKWPMQSCCDFPLAKMP